MSDVITAWQRALEAAKVPPSLAGYRAGADPLRPCRTCGHHDGGQCLIVAGVTSDAGTCDLWSPARSDGRSQDGS